MTAEIAVMNRMAVALAADSAVTVETESGQKIYHTTNKLFALSRSEPVAIMVYGGAQFMGVPWETIIKGFRRIIGHRTFPHVGDFANELLRFLRTRSTYVPEAVEREHVRSMVAAFFSLIRQEIDQAVKDQLESKCPVGDAQVKLITSRTIARMLKTWRRFDDLPEFGRTFRARFKRTYSRDVNGITAKVYEKLPLGSSGKRALRELSWLIFSKRRFHPLLSGVVVAGFGDEDLFPRLHAYEVEGAVCGRLKMRERHSADVARTGATIVPFAQRDVVATFMEGINPRLRDYLKTGLEEFLSKELPAAIVDKLPVSKAAAGACQSALAESAKAVLARLGKELQEYVNSNHVEPIVAAVEVLPVDELAAMAEALVNLTVFRRRMSTDPETVGGPIDVLVLTKGDGLVWIKRKHYFRPDLNPGFFAKHYGKDIVDG